MAQAWNEQNCATQINCIPDTWLLRPSQGSDYCMWPDPEKLSLIQAVRLYIYIANNNPIAEAWNGFKL